MQINKYINEFALDVPRRIVVHKQMSSQVTLVACGRPPPSVRSEINVLSNYNVLSTLSFIFGCFLYPFFMVYFIKWYKFSH